MEKSDSQATPKAPESSSGWPIVTLDEICSITSGITKGRKTPTEPLREVPYMAVVNVQDGRLNLETVKTIQASSSEIERYQLLPGDLLLTEGGDPDKLGRGTVWNGEISECIHQNHIFRVRSSSPLIDIGFLSRLVASPFGKAYFLSKAKQTTGIASINLSQLRTFPVALPPLNEQRRIAAKLDATLAAVDACRQRLDGVEARLKRFRQAVLAAATSGELTREWREERGRDLAPWADKTVGDLVSDIDAGLNLKCDERPPEGDERGLVKISAVTWGTYNEEESKTLNQDAIISEENRICPGDFLISRANTIELVGACVIVHQVTRKLYLSDKVLRLVMPEECKPWLLLCLRSPSGRRQIEGLSSGNQLSMRNLHRKIFWRSRFGCHRLMSWTQLSEAPSSSSPSPTNSKPGSRLPARSSSG
jgi:type I restriction enzyme S subunit